MKKLLVTVFLSLVSVSCIAQKIYKGRCVKVADGDTFTLLLSDNTTVRVRLYGIDCPEKGQDFSKFAKEFTMAFLKDKNVSVEQKDIDRYGRIVAITYAGGDPEPLNEALLRNGLAWHYTRYDQNNKWSALEQHAREAKKGLWQIKDAIAPWEFRKAARLSKPMTSGG